MQKKSKKKTKPIKKPAKKKITKKQLNKKPKRKPVKAKASKKGTKKHLTQAIESIDDLTRDKEDKSMVYYGKEKNRGGRPPEYDTAEELQERISEYFNTGVKMRKVLVGPPNNKEIALLPVPTITGLVIYCGFCDRSSFYDMEKIERFTYTIKRARIFIENEYEELLVTGLGSGAIFALKNFKWKDKFIIDDSTGDHFFDKYKDKTDEELDEIYAKL